MRWIKTETVNLKLLVPSGLTVAALVGGVVGYVAASKILEKKYREIADAEIQEAKVYYQGMYSRPVMVAEEVEKPEPTDEDIKRDWNLLEAEDQTRIMTNAMKAMGTYKSASDAPDETEDPRGDPRPDPSITNVFINHTPVGEEVLDALMADRDPSAPYIITKEEFYQNENDLEQRRFTYFEGDGVLIDDQEEYNPIEDTERVAGDDNLLRFGYGSGDEDSIFIRNESVDPPFDLYVTRSSGKYTEEVLAIDENENHLKHAEPRKFRLRDE